MKKLLILTTLIFSLLMVSCQNTTQEIGPADKENNLLVTKSSNLMFEHLVNQVKNNVHFINAKNTFFAIAQPVIDFPSNANQSQVRY
mgnify:CR=1 FL=1